MTVELHHTLDGPPGAPVLVLGHSLGASSSMWDELVGALSRRLRVLRYDHRGHGRSPAPPGPYSLDELGGDLLALLDRLGVERASICGVSLGGMAGMWLAVHAPERVERLVLCTTSARLGPPEMWEERARAVRAGGMDAVLDGVLDRWLTPAFRARRPDAEQRVADMVRATPAEGYAGGCEAIRDMDLRAELGAIRAPTLAIAAAEDPATPPEHLEAIRAAVPGARLVVLPDASHLLTAEQPAAVADEILRYVQGTPYDAGMAVRRAVLGDAHVDAATARITAFTADFQDFITRAAWGDVWTRPGLDRKTRSAITLTALIAHGHLDELAMHVRAARRNGLTHEEIGEVLLQSAIYCGVPAANSAFAVAQRVLAEEDAGA